VIWSQILQLFHRNDHHIETTCRVQHLGCYREGQGHSMTLQQNRVWPKTLLFEVRVYNYFWQTTSLCPIPIRGALPGFDRLLLFKALPMTILSLCKRLSGLWKNFCSSLQWFPDCNLIFSFFWMVFWIGWCRTVELRHYVGPFCSHNMALYKLYQCLHTFTLLSLLFEMSQLSLSENLFFIKMYFIVARKLNAAFN